MAVKNKKSFLLHIDSLAVLDDLTNEQAGELFKAISAYQNGEDLELSALVKIAFSPFKNQFIRDNEKYESICERRAKAGAMGGKAKAKQTKQEVANASKCKQTVANVADNKNKNKNKTNNKSDNKDIDISDGKKTPSKRFTPPLQNEVYDYMGSYAQEKGKTISTSEPEKFVNFYESKGWMVGKTKMKDWKSAARNWINRIEERAAQQKGKWETGDQWAKDLINEMANGELPL